MIRTVSSSGHKSDSVAETMPKPTMNRNGLIRLTAAGSVPARAVGSVHGKSSAVNQTRRPPGSVMSGAVGGLGEFEDPLGVMSGLKDRGGGGHEQCEEKGHPPEGQPRRRPTQSVDAGNDLGGRRCEHDCRRRE
jgi:hypothetical protein